MKTHTKCNQILRTTLAAIVAIALFSTTANAQRRANNAENEKSRRIEQKAPRYTEKSEAKNKKDYRTQTVKPRSNSDRHYKDNNNYSAHHKSNRHNWDKHKHHSDWYGTYYSSKKNHYRHNDIHVKIRPNYHPHFDIRLNPIVFKRVPRKAVWVNIEGENYVMHRGKFYHSSPYGFYRVYLPTYIKYLPEGCHEVWVNGHQVFRLHGIHFINTPFGYKIIV